MDDFISLPKKYKEERKRNGQPQTQQAEEKRKKHRVNEAKKCVDMDVQTMKEKGQRERQEQLVREKKK